MTETNLAAVQVIPGRTMIQSDRYADVDSENNAVRRRCWSGLIRKHVQRLLLLICASYGLLYFSYKYYVPWSGGNDFANYYNIYLSPLNLHATSAPFVCRQISAVLTNLIFNAGIYYPLRIAFENPQYSQRVFFAALLTNWIFLVLAAWLAGLIAEQLLEEESILIALIAGMFCMLAFETQQAVITGLTEGPAWFLFAAAFFAYLRKAKWLLLIVLVLTIFQRETISIAIATIAALDLLLRRDSIRFRLQVLGASVFCFAVYFLGRKTLVSGWEQQVEPERIASSLFHLQIDKSLIFQGILSQSTMALFLIVSFLGFGYMRRQKIWVLVMLGTLLVIDTVGLLANIGSNIGRIGTLLTPALAGLAAANLGTATRSISSRA